MYLKRDLDGRYVPAGGQTDAACSIKRILNAVEGLNLAAGDERKDEQERARRPGLIKESPDAPLVLEFDKMETVDGIRKQAKMKVINRTSKDVFDYGLQATFFNQKGELVEVSSSGHGAAVGYSILRAHGKGYVTLRGSSTDNYETTRAQAVVTSVTFTDGSKWEAK